MDISPRIISINSCDSLVTAAPFPSLFFPKAWQRRKVLIAGRAEQYDSKAAASSVMRIGVAQTSLEVASLDVASLEVVSSEVVAFEVVSWEVMSLD